MPYDVVFDASKFAPSQMGPKHPPGNKFQATITGTEVKDTKDNTGKYFEITFTTPAGSIRNNYNLWNISKQAVDIAVGQLSAVCHATGIFQVDMKNDGVALRNAQLLIDIGFQAGQEPSAEKPEGGYVEVKKVYDKHGNAPGQASTGQQSSGFSTQQPQLQPNPQVQGGWGEANKPNPAPANQGGGSWQQNANPNTKPPWG